MTLAPKIQTGVLRYAAIALLVFAALLLSHHVLAEAGPPATGESSSGLTGLSKTLGQVPMLIIYALLLVLKALLSWLLLYLTPIMGILLRMNVEQYPTSFTAVVNMWGVMRDIVNSFFILIVLWIALTTVFRIESLGGRRLLVRLVTLALLINFSLVAVTVVFGLSNAFADVFFEQLRDNTCTAVNISTIERRDGCITEYIQNALKTSTLEQATPTEKQKAVQDSGSFSNPILLGENTESGFGSSLLAAAGVKEAQAFWPLLLFGVVALYLTSKGVEAFFDVYGLSYNMALIDVYLLLLIGALIFIVVYLILRLIAMAILSVTAPFAFAAYAFPGGFGEGIWKRWVNELFRWAFFAPAFFFLLYLSVSLLGQAASVQSSGFEAGTSVTSYPGFLLAYAMAAASLIASVVVAKKIAGHTADAATGAVTRLGTLALGGVAGLAVGGAAIAMRRAAPAVIEPMRERVSRIPVLRAVAAPAIKGTIEMQRQQRAKVDESYKKLQTLPAEQAAQYYRASVFAEDKMAAARRLAELKKLNLLPGEEQRMLSIARQSNMERDILKARPDLARPENIREPGVTNKQEAVLHIIERLSVDEKVNLPKEATEDADVSRALWARATPEFLSRLAQLNQPLMQKMQDTINFIGQDRTALQQLKTQMGPIREQQLNTYFLGTLRQTRGRRVRQPGRGHALGWQAPQNWV